MTAGGSGGKVAVAALALLDGPVILAGGSGADAERLGGIAAGGGGGASGSGSGSGVGSALGGKAPPESWIKRCAMRSGSSVSRIVGAVPNVAVGVRIGLPPISRIRSVPLVGRGSVFAAGRACRLSAEATPRKPNAATPMVSRKLVSMPITLSSSQRRENVSSDMQSSQSA
jgi:hypothetical protein